MRILIVEDECSLNEIITKKLTPDGYSADYYYDGEEVISVLSYTDYDAVTLDIMTPKADGFTVLRSLREAGKTTSAFFLTVGDAVSDRVKGLNSGANDYLAKPFAFEELSARLRAITRVPFGMAENMITVADLTPDCNGQTVKRAGKDISLPGKEYALPEYLMRNSGLALSREKIENHIWNFDYEGGTNVVGVYINYSCRKVDDGFDRKLIHTARGRGYVLAGDRPV